MDEDILKRIEEGDQEGLKLLQARYGNLVRYVARGVLGDSRDVEECVSDVFLRAWEKMGQYDPGKGKLSTWLTAVARNTALNKRKGRGVETEPLEEHQGTTPSPEEELELLRRKQYSQAMNSVQQVVDQESLEFIRSSVDRVHISESILQYIIRLVIATRKHPQLLQGASPRATLAITAMSRAVAFLRGRDYVLPEDVQAIWADCAAHRLLLVPGAERSVDVQEIARAALQSVDAPRIR